MQRSLDLCVLDAQGAMYAFPRIDLPPRAIAEALAEGHAPDTHYALSLLESTGICAVPGSGFGQREGTHHLRLTFLPGEDKLLGAMERFKAHHQAYIRRYLTKLRFQTNKRGNDAKYFRNNKKNVYASYQEAHIRKWWLCW